MNESSLPVASEPPCNAACPAGVNVQAYVGLIALGRYREALDVVREALPFPAVCGRVCPAFCESACRRDESGGPIAIRALKRFIADAEEDDAPFAWEAPPVRYPDRIAVIGGGPAGLTASLDLRRLGYEVVLFEARATLGGMLDQCLPAFRLPRHIVAQEINAILAAGIEVRTSVRIGRDITLAGLLDEGFATVLLSVGAHRPLTLGVDGEDARGVLDALDYLSEDRPPSGSAPRSLAVIGGGSTAVDAARTALRRGCEDVHILYRRTRDEMPAGHEEVDHAIEEGVKLQTQVAPIQVIVEDGQVRGLLCNRTRQGEPDASGRRRPVVVPGSEFTLELDAIVAAIGQNPDPVVFSGLERLADRGRIHVIDDSLQTAEARVFGAGDAVSGPATIIEAVGQGHRAATSIHRFLREGRAGPATKPEPLRGIPEVPALGRVVTPRLTIPMLPAGERRSSFAEVELPMDVGAARAEAKRCLRCGSCETCRTCSPLCSWRHAVFENGNGIIGLVRVDRSRFERDLPGATIDVGERTRVASLACDVRQDLCRSCGTCFEVCSHGAVRWSAGEKARIDPASCRGCGICVADCPSGAIDAGPMDEPVLHEILGSLQPGTAVQFRCEWAAAGTEEGQAVVRVPCAGRITAGLVARAFACGASNVAIVHCAGTDCRHGRGAKRVAERLAWLPECDPTRIQILTEES